MVTKIEHRKKLVPLICTYFLVKNCAPNDQKYHPFWPKTTFYVFFGQKEIINFHFYMPRLLDHFSQHILCTQIFRFSMLVLYITSVYFICPSQNKSKNGFMD